jgi:beta-N-acetylhexosaminidase
VRDLDQSGPCRRGPASLAVAAGVVALVAAGCGSSERPKRSEPKVVSLDGRTTTVQRPRTEPRKPPREPRSTGVRKPRIVARPIPFPASRRREMESYAARHYGLHTFRLRDPKVIVEHYTETADARGAISLFEQDVSDPELHELPGVCAHFVIDRDGTIYQLVPLTIMCRHTVGLNYTSIGIEHAGFSDREVLSNRAEMKASLALTRWLRCRFGISIRNVIGHNESLSSPYHRERVARLRTQTHADWAKADMDVYRARLRRSPC